MVRKSKAERWRWWQARLAFSHKHSSLMVLDETSFPMRMTRIWEKMGKFAALAALQCLWASGKRVQAEVTVLEKNSHTCTGAEDEDFYLPHRMQ